MWQHRWALWSGVLGATASCLIKIAVSSESPLQQMVQRTICEPYFLPTNDLDDMAYHWTYKLLGNLMIQHGMNLMKGFKVLREQIIEPTLLYFYIWEVDGCHIIMLGPRILCVVGFLLLNAYMIANFLHGMKESGSVAGTALSSAANVASSAAWGYLVWEERFPTMWWLGFFSLLLGVVFLSSTASSSSGPQHTTHPTKFDRRAPTDVARKKRHRPFSWQTPTMTKPALELRQYGSTTSTTTNTTSTTTSSTTSPRTSSISKMLLAPPASLLSKKRQLATSLVDRSFANECPLCEGQLFDEMTGKSHMAIADLSPNCFHVIHSKCLKQQSSSSLSLSSLSSPGKSRRSQPQPSKCPVCENSVNMWVGAKQAAHFAGFWMDRVETCLQTVGPIILDQETTGWLLQQPLPASVVREHMHQDPTLTDTQKQYIDDDPTGLGKGLASALEWGGYVDYNTTCVKGHVGWSQCLRTKGVWKYNAKHDDIWLWEWSHVYPRQRCDQCQLFKRPLPVECEGCQGSSESAHYCSERCQKRDWQRHKMTCQMWQTKGPNKHS